MLRRHKTLPISAIHFGYSILLYRRYDSSSCARLAASAVTEELLSPLVASSTAFGIPGTSTRMENLWDNDSPPR
ncbi:hypothetical protein F2Q69_00037824 [Brassica cretica]|uniref:Uncharacterized protein n=1 Tax=Brassica cretica TaxID=69181 RepID=A0A8S9SCF8_BRACR|nr:hypothetical protein F2Q69_00037824 [Brassica cretica]